MPLSRSLKLRLAGRQLRAFVKGSIERKPSLIRLTLLTQGAIAGQLHSEKQRTVSGIANAALAALSEMLPGVLLPVEPLEVPWARSRERWEQLVRVSAAEWQKCSRAKTA